jgi:hypothetical protein
MAKQKNNEFFISARLVFHPSLRSLAALFPGAVNA